MPVSGDNDKKLSIVIPAWNEGANLDLLLPDLNHVIADLGIPAEIIVVDADSNDATADVVKTHGAQMVLQKERGYGGALIAGFEACSAEYITTMDADLSHPAAFVRDLWQHRDEADVLIASRYVSGGCAEMSRSRQILSHILNRTFRLLFRLPFRDLSSGFRLYHRQVVTRLWPAARDFDVLLEILITTHRNGYSIREIPFHYMPRGSGNSHARLLKFGRAYLSTLLRLRNAKKSGRLR
jgi:dolichol-phosphate mannosyltransferase